VRGDEARVVDAFCRWLEASGWSVRREVDFVDVAAVRGDERLYAEAKGRTAAIGTDLDTLYGQLLRRMPDDDAGARYAVVVPTVAVSAALRVPAWVRARLRLDIYEVTDRHPARSVAAGVGARPRHQSAGLVTGPRVGVAAGAAPGRPPATMDLAVSGGWAAGGGACRGRG